MCISLLLFFSAFFNLCAAEMVEIFNNNEPLSEALTPLNNQPDFLLVLNNPPIYIDNFNEVLNEDRSDKQQTALKKYFEFQQKVSIPFIEDCDINVFEKRAKALIDYTKSEKHPQQFN